MDQERALWGLLALSFAWQTGAAAREMRRVNRDRGGKGLLRAPFVEIHGDRKILTVYYTTQVDRYWESGR